MSGSRHEWLDDETAERLLNGEPAATAGHPRPAPRAPGEVHPPAMVRDVREVDAPGQHGPAVTGRGSGGAPAAGGLRAGGSTGAGAVVPLGADGAALPALDGLFAALVSGAAVRPSAPAAPCAPPAAGTFAEAAGMPPAGGIDPVREERAVAAFRWAARRGAAGDARPGEAPGVNTSDGTVTRLAAPHDVGIDTGTTSPGPRTGTGAAGTPASRRPGLPALTGAEVRRILRGAARGPRATAAEACAPAGVPESADRPGRSAGAAVHGRRPAGSRGTSGRLMVGSVVTATLLATGVAAAAAGVLPGFLPRDGYVPVSHTRGHHGAPVPPQLPEPAGSASATPTGPVPGRRPAHLPAGGAHRPVGGSAGPSRPEARHAAGNHLFPGIPQARIDHLCAQWEASGGGHAPGRLPRGTRWTGIAVFCAGLAAAQTSSVTVHGLGAAPDPSPTAGAPAADPAPPSAPPACCPPPGVPSGAAACGAAGGPGRAHPVPGLPAFPGCRPAGRGEVVPPAPDPGPTGAPFGPGGPGAATAPPAAGAEGNHGVHGGGHRHSRGGRSGGAAAAGQAAGQGGGHHGGPGSGGPGARAGGGGSAGHALTSTVPRRVTESGRPAQK